MAVETIHVRGEGGSVIAMDLPLPEGIAQRYADGLIVRVNPDGSDYVESSSAAPEPAKPARRNTKPKPTTESEEG